MINTKLFLDIREAILAHPHRVNMNIGCILSDCGTVGCIAGWACIIAGGIQDSQKPDEVNNKLTLLFDEGPFDCGSRKVIWRLLYRTAIKLLGIDETEAFILFHFHDPVVLGAEYHQRPVLCRSLHHLRLKLTSRSLELVGGLERRIRNKNPSVLEYAQIVVEAIDCFLAYKGFDVAALLTEQAQQNQPVEELELVLV